MSVAARRANALVAVAGLSLAALCGCKRTPRSAALEAPPTPEDAQRAPSARAPRALAGSSARGNSALPSLRVPRLAATNAITIDGKLDEAAWQSAPQNELVDVTSGAPNRSFPVNASFRLAWSERGFYVAFEVRDADVVGGFEKPVAGVREPHLWTRDTVEIMVDPDGDGDNRDYYEIQVNPQNLVFDSAFDDYNTPRQLPAGPFGHEEWSSGVVSRVSVRGTLDRSDDVDQGYVVEAFVPWSAFDRAQRSPPAVGDTWRMNFYAMQNNGGVAWSPILGQGNFHRAARFGRVLWLEKG